MKYCQKCGKEIHDEAVICPGCGCAVPGYVAPNTTATETSSLATSALAFSFLMPIIGLILGIVGAVKYKTEKFRTRCIGSIFISFGVWLGLFLILMNTGY